MAINKLTNLIKTAVSSAAKTTTTKKAANTSSSAKTTSSKNDEVQLSTTKKQEATTTTKSTSSALSSISNIVTKLKNVVTKIVNTLKGASNTPEYKIATAFSSEVAKNAPANAAVKTLAEENGFELSGDPYSGRITADQDTHKSVFYDANGRVSDLSTESKRTGSSVNAKYTYNDKGEKTETITHGNCKEVNVYNADGTIKSSTEYIKDKVQNKNTYSYSVNTKGEPVQTMKNSAGEITTTTLSNGKYVQTTKNAKTSADTKIKNAFTDNSNASSAPKNSIIKPTDIDSLPKSTIYNGAKTVAYQKVDSKGRVVEYTIADPNQPHITRKYNDKTGEMTEVIEYNKDGKSSTTTNVFNKNGTIKTSNTLTNPPTFSYKTYTYTTDKHGNPIQEMTESTGIGVFKSQVVALPDGSYEKLPL